jgi:hypothetical protein
MQEDGFSLDTREEACRRYAAQHGYQAGSVFREVHTGSDLHERPALTTLRAAVSGGQIDVVIAYAVDRLSRKQAHVAAKLPTAGYEMKRTALEWLDVRVRLFREDAPDRYLIDAVSVDEDGVIQSLSVAAISPGVRVSLRV